MNSSLNVSDLLELAILIEQDGYSFYTVSAKKLKDIKLISFFHFLAEEEMKHERNLKNFKNRNESFMQINPLPKEYNKTLKNYLDSLTPQKNINLRKKIEELSSIDDALNLALEFEKDSLTFYSILKTVIESDLNPIIDQIISEEIKHILNIYEYKTTGLPEPEDKHST